MAGHMPGGGRLGRRYRPLTEINVTPFVDVVVVLLLMFMVTAPLMTVGVPVDLPRTQAQALAQEQEPITISVNQEGRIFLQDTEIEVAALVPRLQAILGAQRQGANEPQRRIFVRGDRTVAYGRIMEVMGVIAASGFTRVALLAEQPAGAPARRN